MPYQFTAQSVDHVNPLEFKREGETVTGLKVNVSVNYGTMGMVHQIDLWPSLTDTQKAQAQATYNFIRNRCVQIVLGT